MRKRADPLGQRDYDRIEPGCRSLEELKPATERGSAGDADGLPVQGAARGRGDDDGPVPRPDIFSPAADIEGPAGVADEFVQPGAEPEHEVPDKLRQHIRLLREGEHPEVSV